MIITPSYTYAEICSRVEKLKREKPELTKKYLAPPGARARMDPRAIPGSQTTGQWIKTSGGENGDATLPTKKDYSASEPIRWNGAKRKQDH